MVQTRQRTVGFTYRPANSSPRELQRALGHYDFHHIYWGYLGTTHGLMAPVYTAGEQGLWAVVIGRVTAHRGWGDTDYDTPALGNRLRVYGGSLRCDSARTSVHDVARWEELFDALKAVVAQLRRAHGEHPSERDNLTTMGTPMKVWLRETQAASTDPAAAAQPGAGGTGDSRPLNAVPDPGPRHQSMPGSVEAIPAVAELHLPTGVRVAPVRVLRFAPDSALVEWHPDPLKRGVELTWLPRDHVRPFVDLPPGSGLPSPSRARAG